MTIRCDILAAKEDYTRHKNRHRCQTGDPCPERVELWLAYMHVAERWGLDDTDAARRAARYTLAN